MPTFDSRGEPSRTGAISCLTCHEPHMAGSIQGEAGPGRDVPEVLPRIRVCVPTATESRLRGDSCTTTRHAAIRIASSTSTGGSNTDSGRLT